MKSVPTTIKYLAGATLVAAALALPSYQPAFAEAAPEKSIIAFKYLDYEDSQPGQERISVNAFSIMGMAPIAGKWSISTTYTNDSVTGASPANHTYVASGASTPKELRQAVDVSLTRYFSKGNLTAGSSYSKESDYISRSTSLLGSLSTEDKNTTLTLGGSYTNDTINPNNHVVRNEKKEVIAGMVGVTQILTKKDIVQVNFGYSKGDGYYDDPYKVNLYGDIRPDKRDIKTVMTRWNHYFERRDVTTRLSYRYYTDTFGIKAHTFGLEYIQPVAGGWTVIPSARFSSQTAADFYLPADPFVWPDPPDPQDAKYYSYDQRLSAFGAVTLGIKVEKRIAKDWLLDAKFENYEQRARWCMTGGGDKGLAPFNARYIQFGVLRQF